MLISSPLAFAKSLSLSEAKEEGDSERVRSEKGVRTNNCTKYTISVTLSRLYFQHHRHN